MLVFLISPLLYKFVHWRVLIVCRWLHIWCLNAERNVTFRIVWSWKEFPFFLHHLKATLSGASRRFPLVGSECACAWLSSSEAKSGFYPGGLHQRNENKKVKGSFGGVNYQCRRSFLHDVTAVVGVILHFRLRRKQKPSRKCLLIPKRWTKESHDTLLFCLKTRKSPAPRLKRREELKSEEIIGSFGRGGTPKPKRLDMTTQEFVRRRNVSYFQITACSFTSTHFPRSHVRISGRDPMRRLRVQHGLGGEKERHRIRGCRSSGMAHISIDRSIDQSVAD